MNFCLVFQGNKNYINELTENLPALRENVFGNLKTEENINADL
jgi:hypothetical protein